MKNHQQNHQEPLCKTHLPQQRRYTIDLTLHIDANSVAEVETELKDLLGSDIPFTIMHAHARPPKAVNTMNDQELMNWFGATRIWLSTQASRWSGPTKTKRMTTVEWANLQQLFLDAGKPQMLNEFVLEVWQVHDHEHTAMVIIKELEEVRS